MQDDDYKWYKNNCSAIFSQYGNSFVVIKDKVILGAYPTYAEGLTAASATESLGSFIVQKCTGNEEGYTNYISSMDFVNC